MNSKNSQRGSLNLRRLTSKDLPNEHLLFWLAQPRNPVLASPDPLVKMFIRAMIRGQHAKFVYVGGSTPGLPRIVTVSLVFQHEIEGRVYVAGYCHMRRENRVFAVDKAMVIWSPN